MAKLNGKKRATLYDLFHKNPLAGKGVSKADKLERNFKNFFKLSWWHMGTIISVNLIFLIGNFPIMFGLLAISGIFTTSIPAPSSVIYANLFGVMQDGADPLSAALYSVHGIPSEMAVQNTTTTVLFALTLLIVITWGFVNVGTTYILRNLIKGDPIFFFHDFFYAIKRNWRQGFIMGILDLIFIFMIGYGLMIYYYNMPSTAFLFYLLLFVAFIYFLMRFYIYTIMITFDLSLFKIIKNAFIFAGVAMKRNALGFFGIALFIIIDWYLLKLITPLGIIIPMVFLYGYCAYIGSYVSWPKIKQLMVDPYDDDEKQSKQEAEIEEAPIFEDDVK